jgi:MFS superfamily sulfate permease-like transporter
VAEHPPAPADTPALTPGFKANLRFDLLSGFLVFLIAMPLCLGIAKASEYPPIAGIWTAVIGGILTTFLSNSQLTIKGPAAGLIVVVAGSVVALGKEAVPQLPAETVAAIEARGAPPEETKKALDKELQVQQLQKGYFLALGAAVVAGVLQILLGLLKAGALGELVPLMPVHGMLAAIGITIMAKSLFPMLGIPSLPSDLSPIEVIVKIPGELAKANPTIAAIGLLSLGLLVAFPFVKARVKGLNALPAQLIVLAVAIPLGLALGLGDLGKEKGTNYFVAVPNILANPSVELPNAFHGPDFSALATLVGLQAVLMFCLIASIESLLSAQAIDMIDPWRRKTNLNRDLLACGAANTLCAAVGALPMISEIVRSKANIDNGARTKYSNLFHGLFLLAFVLLLPMVINIIPLAALAAMLVFVGYRLASPKEFIHTWKIGPEQLLVFVTTIVVTLSTDLLIGVCSGIALKVVLHVLNGVPIGAFWRPEIEVAERDTVAVLVVKKAAVFSGWLAVRAALWKAAEGREEVVVDLSQTRLVDHSVMEKLHQVEKEFAAEGKRLRVVGLDNHRPLSSHPLAARKGPRSGAALPSEQVTAG